MNKYLRFIKEPAYRFKVLDERGHFIDLSDEKYLSKKYRAVFGKKLDLENPQTFNEKIQWLKLYDRKEAYTTMVDKYAVRQYIANRIGAEYLIPLVGGPWKSFDEIDFDALPDQFVLKCTHDSGGLVIVRDKSNLDIPATKEKMERCLARNYYYHSREWPYKDVPPRIIAEQYIKDGDNQNLPVYKIFCFNGQPKVIQTIQNDKQPNESIDYFDPDWNLLKLRQNFPNSKTPLHRPNRLKEMLEIAKALAATYSFIRIDLYTIDDNVMFSEHTFFSDSGLAEFYPENWDKTLGELLVLPENRGGGGGYIITLDELVFYVKCSDYDRKLLIFDDNGSLVSANEPVTQDELTDYKFFCFDGCVKALFIATDRASCTEETKFDFFDMEFNHLPFTNGHPNAKSLPLCPVSFGKMKILAEKLSEGIPLLRVDFYDINGRVYIGELTLFHWSGMVPFVPEEWDKTFGNWINLPTKAKN